MLRLRQITQHVVEYPVREYHRFQDHRERRTRDEHFTWSLDLWKRLHPSLQQGYKYCLILVVSVWLLCLVYAIWIGATHKAEPGLVYTLQTGNCGAARSLNFWIHLVINIQASSLYAVSSFVMQRIVAPAREDVDKAHHARQQLKIGSLAIMNLSLLGNKRVSVFALLWASSLPIHLMFNSLIVYSSTNAEWPSYVFMLQDGQLDSFESNRSILAIPDERKYDEMPGFYSYGTMDRLELEAQYLLHQLPPLVDLTLPECIDTFGSGSSETWGDVVLVHSSESEGWVDTLKQPSVITDSYLPTTSTDPWNWMCGGYSKSVCDAQSILTNGTWTVDGHIVTRCLARQLPDLCELNTSLAIMIVVLVCISCKLVSIIFAVALGRNQSLLTIGDAVASFLQDPETISRNHVFYKMNDNRQGYHAIPRTSYENRRRRVMREMKGAFWTSTLFGIAGLSLAWWFFSYTFRETRSAYADSRTPFDFGTMLRFGFGNMPAMWTSDLESHILSYGDAQNPSLTYTTGATLANLPQIALSAYYLVFNNYITRLFVALEFRSFSTRRRGLRVTETAKDTKQRRAHFLQIPLRYSLLNMAMFALLHTFLSQTLFLRRVYAIYPQSFDDPGDIGKKLLPMIGYSPVSSFTFAILLTVLVVSGILVGLVPIDWRFPDTSGDSFNIAAFCHPPEGTENTQEGEVRWGVTKRNAEGKIKCSFSLLPVRPPEVGEAITIR
ncbi:hypothetical protein GGR52DRAFT_419276 [Hypoxylon sp. FL1284]|nr:hypothetical protein GGR52DRAFT_419276 [Hypoxylon sp. FL1284]